MATAGDLINGALRLIGAIAEGETPSGTLSADALTAMNAMISSWSTERLSVFCTQDQSFSWTANQASRTIGPTGNFVGVRPIAVDTSTYFVLDGISYPLRLVNEDQYNSIALKTSTSTMPEVLWVNDTMPDTTLTVYPVPTQAVTIHIISVLALTEPATLATTLSYPPGYERALRYNLACELAPEFGVEPAPRVQRIADVSKRNLKRINNPGDVLGMPWGMIARRGAGFNIYSGNF
jgi:hypothetical protein